MRSAATVASCLLSLAKGTSDQQRQQAKGKGYWQHSEAAGRRQQAQFTDCMASANAGCRRCLQMHCKCSGWVVYSEREASPCRSAHVQSVVTAGTAETVYKERTAQKELRCRYLCHHCCSRQSWWSPGTLVSQALTEVTH